ncbi:hypothetical protein E1B28_001752 [Marasmius oreades]|uniref:Protein kinase domain-containing protein n=1 Tax=Marasmius oreades TaxID=181124 RepID=A0A9P8AFS3_9AGAR|nr:uncharacterized protein E1B28_001752 [Marasmius oreades]KAG7099959.1 hypothetical protein E1B28_001752 [Marasmius oreades]
MLEGNFSKPFKDFVAYCLQRDPRERPSARELLRHKFVRMAKKTSYLTELIERHERWRAEGGDRYEDEERDTVPDMPSGGDPEDLWDFGTVRHASRPATIGRNQNPIQVSGPPLTWENNGTQRSDVSSNSSGSSLRGRNSTSSSITAKGDLPPLPSDARGSRRSDQATVRHMAPAVAAANSSVSRMSQRTAQREPSDDYEDYGDQYGNEKYQREDELEDRMRRTQLDEDVPDTTMLDSVILPAIASLFPRVSSQEARVALSALQRAFTEAERVIPGVSMELVNEIVESVEHVEDDPQ